MSNEQSNISGPGGFNARVALSKITQPTPTERAPRRLRRSAAPRSSPFVTERNEDVTYS